MDSRKAAEDEVDHEDDREKSTTVAADWGQAWAEDGTPWDSDDEEPPPLLSPPPTTDHIWLPRGLAKRDEIDEIRCGQAPSLAAAIVALLRF